MGKDKERRVTQETIQRLTPTVDTFAERIKRKLKEQEIEKSASQRAADTRQIAILQALNIIRRTLQQTAKIDLGQRFHLELEVSDSDGWPRLDLTLIDCFARDQSQHQLSTTVNDRQELGTIELTLDAEESLLRFSVTERGALERLPLILKKSLRAYLDVIAQYVLDPIKPEELIQNQAKPVVSKKIEQNLNTQELYSTEQSYSHNSVHVDDESVATIQLTIDPPIK